MGGRFLAVFADTPVLFFAVVIGVALTFRVAVGVARDAATPDVVAPTFVTGAEPSNGVTQPVADPDSKPSASASASGNGSAEVSPRAEVGAAAKVQPIGRPAPAHVAPKPRGHGRRAPTR